MYLRQSVRRACAFVAALLLGTSLQAAGLFRAYVASTGSDTNPCTLPQPCRLLPAALTAVADGGEIWMLDSANFNTSTVNIAKSVTILAIPGAVGSLVATGGGDGITINAAGVKVALRNLVIVHLTSSQHGVSFVQGAELNVSECEIANVHAHGIAAIADNAKVTVRNSVLRDIESTGVYIFGTVVASLDGVHVKGSDRGVYAGDSSRVTVTNSVLSGNTYGAHANGSAGTVRLVVERSVVTGNLTGIFAETGVASLVEITASHNAVTHNGSSGINTAQGPSSTVIVVADGNTVTENGIGFYLDTATIYTRGNNTVKFNVADVLGGGSLTPLAGQ